MKALWWLRNLVRNAKKYYYKKYILNTFLFSALPPDDVESLKTAKSGFIQSLFCCWRRTRSKTQLNGAPGFGGASGGVAGTNSATNSQISGGRVRHLLPPVRHQDMHKKCMVIDLDETLVHSSFKVSFWMFYW